MFKNVHITYSIIHICEYAYTGANFFLLFLILSVEEDTTLLTLQKITVFPGSTKVGPICPNFIRGDPYEPHRPAEKVTFSDHQFGWFWASESCKSLCLASILVRYEVPTRFLNLPPITPIFIGWWKICPPRVPIEPKTGQIGLISDDLAINLYFNKIL